MTDLPQELAKIAGELTPTHLNAWANVLWKASRPSPAVEAALIDARPGYALGTVAGRLVRAWARDGPTLPGTAVALALQAAGHVQAQRTAERGTIVVSGPTSDAVPVRLTSQVAVEVIRSAKSSLLVVSFVAYGVEEVVTELSAAAQRGVGIDLIFEGAIDDTGSMTGAARAFRTLTYNATFWHWPSQHRPAEGSSLHAKLIAADEHTALIGSANLTDRALKNNLEIGIVLRERASVRRLVRHFRALMRPGGGPLETAQGPSITE